MPSMIEIGPVVLEKKIFKICHVFSQFRNYLSLEKGGVHHLNKLKSPTAKDDLWFGWNWPSGSGEDFLNLSIYFHNFVITEPPITASDTILPYVVLHSLLL